MRRSFESHADDARTIERLQHELTLTRETVFELLPEKAQTILRSYYDCQSTAETYPWLNGVLEELIELAEPREPDNYPNEMSRARCPLCGTGAAPPSPGGFLLPEGLRRHLAGWGGTQVCRAMDAVLGLAKAWWHHEFADTDAAEEQRRRAALNDRRSRERLFKLNPQDPPKLLDELGYGDTPRSPDGLTWAEERLKTLGFAATNEGRSSLIRRFSNLLRSTQIPEPTSGLASRFIAPTVGNRSGAPRTPPFR